MRDCPAGCGPLTEYVHVLHCKECGWYDDLRKPRSSDAIREQNRERRSDWRRFSFTPDYTAFQHHAMIRHLRATPVIDRVYIGAHDAFGNPEGSWVMFAK